MIYSEGVWLYFSLKHLEKQDRLLKPTSYVTSAIFPNRYSRSRGDHRKISFGENDGALIACEVDIEIEDIQKRINKNPKLATLFSEHLWIKKADLPEIIGFNHYVIKETSGWSGGLPPGNIKPIYKGFGGNNANLNRDIQRYHTSDEAKEYFIRNYTPTGLLYDPVIALHPTNDRVAESFDDLLHWIRDGVRPLPEYKLEEKV